LDDEAEDSSGDGEREDENQSEGLRTIGYVKHLIDLHYPDESFVVPDDDFGEPNVQSPSPLMETCAWDILEEHLLTDLSFGEMLKKLQTYLGPRYCEEDWKEAVDSMFLTDGDVGEALIALRTIKGRYIPPPSDATTTFNSSPTHPSNPSSASIWDDKVADLFTRFNNPDSRLLGTAPDSRNFSVSNCIAPVTSGKWMVTVPSMYFAQHL
jgi:hypothetical protein